MLRRAVLAAAVLATLASRGAFPLLRTAARALDLGFGPIGPRSAAKTPLRSAAKLPDLAAVGHPGRQRRDISRSADAPTPWQSASMLKGPGLQ